MPKSTLRFPAIFLFGIYAVYGCLLTPLMEYVITDTVLQNTILYDFLDLLYNLLEALGIASAFSFLIHGVYSFGAKALTKLYLLTGGTLLFKYVSSLIAVSIMRGSLDLTDDYTSIIVAFFIEIAECALVVFLAHRWVGGLLAESKRVAAAAQKLGTHPNATLAVFPFHHLFNRSNALQRTAFWGILTMTVLRLLSFIIGDISYSIFFSISYTFIDVLVLLVYAIILILIPSFLGYLLTLGCMRLAEHQTRLEK